MSSNIVETVVSSDLMNTADNILNTLAVKLGVGVDYFWPLFVKQQIIESYTYLATLGAFLLLSFIAFIVGIIGYKKSEEELPWVPLQIIGGVLFLICIMIGLAIVPECYLQINNPEIFALREIIGVSK